MAVNQSKIKLLVSSGLLLGFPGTYAVDLLGLAVHQWLALLLAGLTVCHLILNWDWCRAVTGRLADSLSFKRRDAWILNAGLLAGFAVLLITGLAISTWRVAAPAAHGRWLDWHNGAFYASLGLLLVKLALKYLFSRHLSWMPAPSGSRPLNRPSTLPGSDPAGAPLLQPAWGTRLISRRQALLLAGIAGMSIPLAFKGIGFTDRLLAKAFPPRQGPATRAC